MRRLRARTWWMSPVVSLLVILAHASPVQAYLKLGSLVNGQSVTLTWPQTPVRYFVTERGVDHVGPMECEAAIGRAFATWQRVPTTSISYQFAGYTAALPMQADGLSTLGFLERPDLDRVLASTDFIIDTDSGAIVESDIFFNASFGWSVAPAGEPGRYDLESIALHEIGHFSGLGHSALGETAVLAGGGRSVIAAEAVMFPIAFQPGNISGRTLRADDIAGISDLYPANDFNRNTGSVSGRVTENGVGVFGAHVVAFNPATGSLVANFSLDDRGQFSIAGLSPGPHVLRVEPLDDVDVDSFFDATSNVNAGFRVAFSSRLVVVPRGGDSGAVDLYVASK